MSISEPFIRRPIATSLLMGALALVGIVAFPLLPVAPLPQVDFPTIQVQAQLAGASPDTMASTVASPLERQVRADFRRHPDDLHQRARLDRHHAAIRPQPQRGRGRPGRAGGDHRRRPPAPDHADLAADLSQGQPGGCADPHPGRAFRHAAADHRRRFRRHGRGAADFADHRRRAGHHRRTSRSRRSASRSIRRSCKRAG